jgi:cytochrome c oxidase subunit 2
MFHRIISSVLLIALCTACLSAQAEGDPAKGKTHFVTCLACHGENGEGNKELNAPRIGGMEAWYVSRQIQNFRSGSRGSDPKDIFGQQMTPMSQTLPDDQAVEDVAAYVASLSSPKAGATVTGDAEKGKASYAICAACHGANGEGNQALNSPALAGQHDWYTVRQLQYFKDGTRGTASGDTFGAQMRPMAMTLADEQAMKDVAAYINTLK